VRPVKPERSRATIPQTTEIIALLVASGLVLAIAILTYQNWTAYQRRADELSVSQRVVSASTGLLSSLKDAETGQRGFLLTGSESYLEPYHSALQQIPVQLEQLDHATEKQPDQAQRLAAIKVLVQQKLQELAKTIDIFRSRGAGAALAEVNGGQGKQVMDRIRDIVAQVGSVANKRLYRQTEAAHTSAVRAGWISVLGSVAIFALLSWSTLTIHLGTRRRQELISALQQSEEQTRLSRDWLQTTLGSIGDGVIATGPDGRVAFLNPVAQSLTGWTQAEAAGLPLEQVFAITNEKTGAVVENPVTKALRENKAVALANHTILTSKDGRRIPIDDTAAPIRNSEGEVAGGVLVFRDVIKRRQAERFEAGVRERYQFFANASQELSSSLDYEQTLQSVAHLAVPAFADYCIVDLLDDGGVRPVAHAHIDPVKDALLVEKRRRFPLTLQHHHPVAAVLRTGQAALIPETRDEDLVATAVNVEHLTILRSLIPCSSIVVPLKARENTLGTITFATGHAESGRIYDETDLVWATEIAQRAALALDNARLYREAHEARRAAESAGAALTQINDELQQFTFATSHDLREPLRTINIYTQLIQRNNEGKLDAQSNDFLNLVLSGASRMERLIDALLDYSKAGEVTNEPLGEVDIEAALESTLEMLGRTIEEGGAEVTHDHLPRIMGSEIHIGQLLQNLISNALKYRRDEPLKVHVSARHTDGRWLFMVSDNGQGIPPDQFSNIFAVFTRLHGHDYPGTGIGLATCRKIVERYGGRIWVESEIGKGSTFFFTLPGRPEPNEPGVLAEGTQQGSIIEQ
jgi:PAS domain S-box-containing protein